MISKIGLWLNMFNDAKFLQDVSTAEGRQKKLQHLRRVRLFSFIGFVFTVCFSLLMLYLRSPFMMVPPKPEDVFAYTVLIPVDVTLPCLYAFLCLIFLTAFTITDTQIKMLLLYEKTQTE
jgi:hypothetical protein